MAERARISVLAGVNGAGKSSVAGEWIRAAGSEYFNPDEATQRLLAAWPSLTPAEANSRAWEEIRRRWWREEIPRGHTGRSSSHPGSRMAERSPDIHLCGHEHRAGARMQRVLGSHERSIRLAAGAAHGDSSTAHGYAWGAIRWNGSRWELGWAPRVFVPGEGHEA